MKRIITFLLIATMLFTFAFSASAATVSEGMNVSYTEDANDIVTVRVNMVGVNNVSAVKVVVKYTSDYTLLTTAKETFTKTSDKAANYTAVVNELADGIAANAWSAKSLAINTAGDQVTVTRGKGSGTDIDCTEATDFIEFYFKKADSVELTNTDIYMNNNSVSGTSYGSGTKTIKLGEAVAKFNESYAPYTAPVEDKPEEGWEEGSAADLTSEDKAAWDDAFKFKTSTDGEDEATGTAPAGKKLVIFAKNATAKTLAAESYGVKIGKNDYPGLAPVAGGKAWAIIILDENGNQVAKDSYDYTAYVKTTEGVVTNVFTGKVNAVNAQ